MHGSKLQEWGKYETKLKRGGRRTPCIITNKYRAQGKQKDRLLTKGGHGQQANYNLGALDHASQAPQLMLWSRCECMSMRACMCIIL